MKKMKFFGKEVSAVLLGVLLVAGLGSAAVIGYLSSTASGSTSVAYASTVLLANADAEDASTYGAMPELAVDSQGWTGSLTMDGAFQLSTVEAGIQIANNGDVALEDKTLEVVVSDTNKNVTCDDITSFKFLDTATSTQLAKGYQELEGLCNDSAADGTVTYAIDINSLAAKGTYEYPVKITFGAVAPTAYTFNARIKA